MTVSAYAGRLYFGGTPENPLELFASELNSLTFKANPVYANVNVSAEPTTDEHAFSFTLTAPKGSFFTDIAPSKNGIICGFSKAIYRVYGEGGVLSRTNFVAESMDIKGAVPGSFVVTDSHIMYSAYEDNSIVLIRKRGSQLRPYA